MEVKVIGSTAALQAPDALEVTYQGKKLNVSLQLEQDDLAPLFDGAAWAGTQLWDAAIIMVRYIADKHGEQLKGGCKVLEVGCGTGVPGMCLRVLGAKVTLTEQPQLVPLLQQNLDTNFAGDKDISARELSWSTEATRDLLGADGPYDIIVSCDCVFPPVYGESWKLLGDSIREVLSQKKDTVVLLSFERRKGDQLEDFFEYCKSNASPAVVCERVLWEDPICIYRASLAES